MREHVLNELRAACHRHETELRALVVRAAGDGVPSQAIAEALGVSRATLWRRYGHELSNARAHST